ncbi:MAG: MBL fold metallo-hydrolase [Calothrix sp. MO_167.B42]|nr:MBL fold metallo-hydrolase [Calothrix sp. MO_167.B42]
MCPINQELSHKTKQPKAILPNIFAFPPSRDTLGGTSYLIVENEANILIDCPAWETANQDFLSSHGGIDYLFITHRGAIGKITGIQQTFNCEILIQEQEAYLLPELKVTTFREELQLNPSIELIWTPGHSPGSSCLYYGHQGGIIFSGRHLLPNQQGEPQPLRTAKTFHWRRQINSLSSLLAKFSPDNLQYILPGANTGFLRGKGVIDNAYGKLAQLDLQALLQNQPLL